LQTGHRRIVAETAVAGLGLIGLVLVFRADAAWFTRHFLPEFFQTRDEQLRALTAVRAVGGVAALVLLIWLRPRFGRLAARRGFRRLALDAAPFALAVVLALGVSEAVVQRLPWRAQHQAPVQREPIRHWNDELGWAYAPSRVGRGELGGRMVEYAFDAAGHRVGSPAEPVDYAAPSILFVGESIVAGNGLLYDETIPAQVGRLTGLQPANLAVGGYATDQMYLRLAADWPRFKAPRAVVVLFMPRLFFRNLDTDRPHLGPGLQWRGPSKDPRLLQLARRLAPYRTEAEIAAAEAATREQLRAVVALARGRGAAALVLVPQLGPESEEEAAIRQRILDAAAIPYVRVPLDPAWRIPGNSHPDARAARVMAQAVASRLRAAGLP
jgi:hypothetical protein